MCALQKCCNLYIISLLLLQTPLFRFVLVWCEARIYVSLQIVLHHMHHLLYHERRLWYYSLILYVLYRSTSRRVLVVALYSLSGSKNIYLIIISFAVMKIYVFWLAFLVTNCYYFTIQIIIIYWGYI